MTQRRKRSKQQRQVDRVVAQPVAVQPIIQSEELSPTAGQPLAAAAPSVPTSESSAPHSDQLRSVKRDLAKVALVLVVVAAVLAALLMTNQQTGWLDRIADTVYRWLRLG